MSNVTPLRSLEPVERGNLLRAPPHNLEAERAVLGAILLNNRAYEHVVDFLKPEHFADAVNGRIYGAIAKLIEGGLAANPVTLKSYVERDELVMEAGGARYIAALANSVITVVNAADYGRVVADLWLRRALVDTGDALVSAAFDVNLDVSAAQVLEEAEAKLFDLAAPTARGSGLKSIEHEADAAIRMAEEAHRRGGGLVGVTTGLGDLDRQLGGLHPSDMIILAGRPSMGKTALATTIAYNAARYFRDTERDEERGRQVAFFSLEMSGPQLSNRILAALAKIDSHRIRTGRLSQDEFARLVSARGELAGLPLSIDDTPAATVAAIRTRARRLARKKGGTGLGAIVVDYLQLIGGGGQKREENRVQELGTITRGLKAVAKDLNVPVIALSQLSRAVEQREDKRPQLSDLRESGTIEQDADAVLFVFREQYYLERNEPTPRADESDARFADRHTKWQERCAAVRNVAEVIVSKQRHGPIGTVQLHFDPPTTWFSDLSRHVPAAEPPPGLMRHPAWEQLPMEGL